LIQVALLDDSHRLRFAHPLVASAVAGTISAGRALAGPSARSATPGRDRSAVGFLRGPLARHTARGGRLGGVAVG
jgi:hypothetical protein